jgi:hypothetical protein
VLATASTYGWQNKSRLQSNHVDLFGLLALFAQHVSRVLIAGMHATSWC